MGEVYRARDTRLGREVAIKVLPEKLVSDRDIAQRFANEARAIGALSHPNICALFDIGEQDNLQYLVMELLRGETLADRLERGPIPLTEALQIAAQIANALDVAHKNGTVHRDLKPSNVMLTESGAKLLDFGVARFLDGHGLDQSTVYTTPGAVVGTVSYMSPEQVRGFPVDGRGDLWSLGVMLYEMVSGKHPFRGPTTSDTISQILTAEPPPFELDKLEVPEALEDIIFKALAKDCEQRYQSARDMLIDIKRLKARLEGRETTTTGILRAQTGTSSRRVTTIVAPPPPSRTWSWVLGVVAVALVAAAAIAWRSFTAQAPAGPVIAVMPMSYNSPDPKSANDPDRDYLADGLTENLIDAISAVSDAEVISRTSVFRYKNADIDPRQVGRDLNVSKILYGKMFRQGNDLRISFELVDAATSRHLWGNQYEATMTTLMSLPKDVALQLVKTLSLHLRNRSLGYYTASPTAYQEYLRGRHAWNKRTGEGMKAAIEHFQNAIAADPQYAIAYAGLADAYHLLWIYGSGTPHESYLKAKPAATKALELDPQLAEAHTSMAVIKGDDEWDFAGAEREFRKAIELDPNYATAHHWYAQWLSYRGKFDQAVPELRTAIRLDPLSPVIHATLGDVLYAERHYPEASDALKKALDIDSGFPLAHSLMRFVDEARGEFNAAIEESKAATIAWSGSPEQAETDAAELRRAYSQEGEKGYWQAQLRISQERIRKGTARQAEDSPVRIAGLYAHLGDNEHALEWLNKGFEERDATILYLKTSPDFDRLRSDPRVIELMKRIGL